MITHYKTLHTALYAYICSEWPVTTRLLPPCETDLQPTQRREHECSKCRSELEAKIGAISVGAGVHTERTCVPHLGHADNRSGNAETACEDARETYRESGRRHAISILTFLL